MGWFKKSSIRRGGGLLIAVLVLAFGVYAFFSWNQAFNFFEKNNKSALLKDAGYISAEIDGFISKYITVVDTMSVNPDTIKLFNELDDKYKKRENPLYKSITEYFKEIKQLDDNVALVYIAFLSSTSGGDLVTDMYDYDAKDNYNLRERPWYKESVKNGNTTVTNPYIDYVTDRPVISIAKPYYVDGKAKGAFAIDVMIDDIYKMMGEYKIGKEGYTILFNSEGNLLYYPDIDMKVLLENNVGDFEFGEFSEEMLDGHSHVTEFENEGKSYYVASVPLKNTNWVVASVIPQNEILSPIYKLMNNNFWMLSVVILIIALFISFMINLISNPIIDIAKQMRSFRDDSNKISFPEKYYDREDEIGILVNGLDLMARSIEEYIEEIKQKNNKLLEEIKSRTAFQDKLEMMLELLSSTEEGIFIMNDLSQCIYSNFAFEKMTGYNELTLKNMSLLKSNVLITEDMVNLIRTSGKWDGEMDYKKDDENIVLYVKIQGVNHDSKRYYIGNISDITSYKNKEKELYKIQHFDNLTNLHNKASFEKLSKNFLEQKNNQKQRHSVIMINIDNFRLINEAKGFDFGNEVLIKIARELEKQVEEKDLLARLGNDEFVILKTNIGGDEELYSYVLELYKNLNTSHMVLSEELFTNLRFGISVYPSDASDHAMLLKNATSALNNVKSGNGSSFAFYNKDLNERSIYKYELKNRLKNAIDAEELVLYYQPQMDIKNNKIMGIEALIRWKTNGDIIPPNVFIPIAEEYNLIVSLGEWVLYKACEFGYKLYQKGYNLQVAVNLSRAQFKNPYITILVNSVLEKTKFPSNLLELEITESILMENEQECEIILENFRNMGIKIAIDDFGTGYSSLSYLKKFAVDKIKIDRAFIKDIPHKDNGAIARVIIDLARILNIEVIAEGVEEKEHIEFLSANGCPQAQGFLYSKPVPEEDIIDFIEKNLN